MIDNIPKLMAYMVQGYIFISIYNFILFRSLELKHVFFKSVVISFILKTLFDGGLSIFHLKSTSSILYFIGLFIFSVLISLGIALCVKSRRFNRLLLKIGIQRTVNQNIWDDVLRSNCWLMVYSKDGNRVYYGQYRYGEESKSEPIIALMHYQIMDMDGDILCDYSNDDNELILINLNGFERIEITYPNSSDCDPPKIDYNADKTTVEAIPAERT